MEYVFCYGCMGGFPPPPKKKDIEFDKGFYSDVSSGLSATWLLELDSVLEAEGSTPFWHHLNNQVIRSSIIRCNNCRVITMSCIMHK